MANPKRSWLAHCLDWAGFAIQQAISNWSTITSYISGGALMGGLAIFQEVAPIWWGVAFFGGLIGVAVVRAISQWGRKKAAEAAYAEATIKTTAINPLSKTFDSQRMKLSDFYHPFFRLSESVIMRDCEVYGPGSLYFVDNFHTKDCRFVDCDIVIVRNSAKIPALMTGFSDLRAERTSFYRITVYMNAETARAWKAKMIPSIGTTDFPIISDGQYGEIS